MRQLAAALALSGCFAIATAEEDFSCSEFEGGVYTTVKTLEFFNNAYCVGWSDLPHGTEIPIGETPRVPRACPEAP